MVLSSVQKNKNNTSQLLYLWPFTVIAQKASERANLSQREQLLRGAREQVPFPSSSSQYLTANQAGHGHVEL